MIAVLVVLAFFALIVFVFLTSAVWAIAGGVRRLVALVQEQNVHYGIGVGDLSEPDEGVAPIGPTLEDRPDPRLQP